MKESKVTLETFEKSVNDILNNLSMLRQKTDLSKIREFVTLLNAASKKIFVYGAGRSGLIAKCFAQRLMHLGFNVYVIGETLNPACEKDDLVIIVSGSGETSSCVAIGEKAKMLGAKLVVITSHPESTLAKYADVTVPIRAKTKLVEEKTSAPFSSLFDVTTLVVLDSIIAELMTLRNLDEETIKKRHATLE
jgi:6-phospho 3-hexuloisomerase